MLETDSLDDVCPQARSYVLASKEVSRRLLEYKHNRLRRFIHTCMFSINTNEFFLKGLKEPLTLHLEWAVTMATKKRPLFIFHLSYICTCKESNHIG